MVTHTFTPVLRDQNIIFQTDTTEVLVRLDLVIYQEVLVQSLFFPLVDQSGNEITTRLVGNHESRL